MPSYTTADIRNVLFAGHGGSGKTTLVDAMLHAAGAVNRKASVTDGNSFSDFEKEEREHKHSIYSSVLYADHLGKRINILDTPGSPDLIGASLACMPAVETVVIVVNAVSGIEVVTLPRAVAAEVARLAHLRHPRALPLTPPEQEPAALARVRRAGERLQPRAQARRELERARTPRGLHRRARPRPREGAHGRGT